MHTTKILLRACTLALAAMVGWQSPSIAGPAQGDDQQHAFDFHFGTWKTQIMSRDVTASGIGAWGKFAGTVIDQPLWNGHANVEKIEASGSGGHFQGVTLFLYNPKSQQWSERFAGSDDGTLQDPSYGEFKNGVGVFHAWTESGGKKVLQRDIWSNITPDSYHYEIAVSLDGGKTWTTDFVAQLTRVNKAPDYEVQHTPGNGPEHDYDFNMGQWTTRIRAVLNPLSSPSAWSNLNGTHAVYRLWEDWANIGQLEVDGPDGHTEDLALRLYDRKTQQWRVYFANSKSGTLNQPMVGKFENGVGTFVGMDEIDGKTVLIRNTWSGITAKSCQQDWAISTDGGKTWVPTWTSTDTLGG
ncbi:hypothetical protein IHE49_07255 [Rhodanobacter sp. 7MK24]|uniref:hypothetical protein n=1 Tax=Rhodanobacter sp. 7MK24 TaxID=2775922 RepID=UPI001785F5A1|nr:hypothetical protein [Rhodanobacter sp. 7MK24]MBD8880274.1 hypothetical protein [Rhodanobacter sp. 7MK24]